MEKRSIIIAIIFILILPQKATTAGPATDKSVTETLLDYALVKSDVLSYEISKKVETLGNKIDSIKSKIQ